MVTRHGAPTGGAGKGNAVRKFAKVGALALVVSVLAAVGAALPAHATGTLDQSNTVGTPGAFLFAQCSEESAQTFTAGLTGNLDQVDLYLGTVNNPPFNLTVQITTTSSGNPTSTVLATATVNPSSVTPSGGWVSVPLSPAAPSVAGTMYAIVLSVTDAGCPEAGAYEWYLTGRDAYPGGTGADSTDGGTTWSRPSPIDMLFKTYVSPACTRTVSSPTGGFTASGVTCVTNATVNGSINVPAGASLILTNSTVNGSVASSGATSVTICGSRINGSLAVRNSTGPVLVGDAASDDSPCAGNTIQGSALVRSNTADTELGANHIAQSVAFENNIGSSASEGPEVGANTINASLVCSGNASPVTDDGVANHIAGAETGQCSGL
jgi:hypothetical protein